MMNGAVCPFVVIPDRYVLKYHDAVVVIKLNDGFVWGFCMGAQGAQQPTAVSGPRRAGARIVPHTVLTFGIVEALRGWQDTAFWRALHHSRASV